jgi:hypothetical protein
VVGPVIPFENATAVDPYSQRRVARNPVLPPTTSNLSAYSYHRKSDNSDRVLQQELEKDRTQYQPAQRFMDAKVFLLHTGKQSSSIGNLVLFGTHEELAIGQTQDPMN